MATNKTAAQRWVPKLFGLCSIVAGIFDLTRPDVLRAAMDTISMPHYILLILGGGEIIGGTILAAMTHATARQWALAGYGVWAVGGVLCHVLSEHGVAETAPLLGCVSFYVLVLWLETRVSRKAHSNRWGQG